MPRSAVIEEARKIDRTQWRNLYLLVEHFGVTISALRVRLEQLNLLYVDQKTNTLYPSREEAHGQGRLMF
jgi:Zn-dependent peptidase ImmA (M78 family)